MVSRIARTHARIGRGHYKGQAQKFSRSRASWGKNTIIFAPLYLPSLLVFFLETLG